MLIYRYVERAKEIVNAVVVNEDIDNPLIGKLREEVRGLQELLERKEAAIVEHEVKIRKGRKGLRYASSINHFVYKMRYIVQKNTSQLVRCTHHPLFALWVLLLLCRLGAFCVFCQEREVALEAALQRSANGPLANPCAGDQTRPQLLLSWGTRMYHCSIT